AASNVRRASSALDHHLLDLADRLGRVEVFRASARAIHDRVAAIEPERIFQRIEPVARMLVAAIGEPTIGLQQDRGAEIAIAVPPVARAARRAAEAENAFPEPVELGAFFNRLA